MAENFKEKFSALGEKLKVGGSDMSRKMSERMNSLGGKMKELFLVPTPADKMVEEATAENLDGPDWGRNLEICDQVNHERISGQDAVRAIKKRIMIKHPTVQILALTLLETCVKNCDKMFSEVASEKVLDEMVKLIDDRQTSIESREKALKLVEAWGESSDELRYLPVFEETYKSLKSRGVKFPGRDNESLAPIFTPPQSAPITSSNRGVSNRGLALWGGDFEAPSSDPADPANVKETLDKVLEKYDQASAPGTTPTSTAPSAPATTDVNRTASPAFTSVPAHEEPEDLLTGDSLGELHLEDSYAARCESRENVELSDIVFARRQ
ncbi:hypothetical protein R1flu_018726 [Riccia fluitans]|uniref:VHS domain-containing protein n=1 Tax=Riccia fluitans TaxID=41844 RepID=A0ABD1ZGU5_9MARC